jgi:hypothetical protein
VKRHWGPTDAIRVAFVTSVVGREHVAIVFERHLDDRRVVVRFARQSWDESDGPI